MGFPPRKLGRTLDVPMWTEKFFYLVNEKKLVYHETGMYAYYYTETIDNIVPISEDTHEWELLSGARIRTLVYKDRLVDDYNVLPKPSRYHTAGWPKFIDQRTPAEDS